MCATKKQIETDNDVVEESDSESDVSMTDTESSAEEPEAPEAPEEDEDEVILAIKRESERKRDHPPPIQCDDFITDLSFHPHEDLLAVANILGDVILYKYSNEENTVVKTFELHTKACRDIEFSADGNILFSVSKDQAIMLSDVESGKLVRFYEGAHDAPINSILVIDENFFATGWLFFGNLGC